MGVKTDIPLPLLVGASTTTGPSPTYLLKTPFLSSGDGNLIEMSTPRSSSSEKIGIAAMSSAVANGETGLDDLKNLNIGVLHRCALVPEELAYTK